MSTFGSIPIWAKPTIVTVWIDVIDSSSTPPAYLAVLETLKERLRSAQLRVAVAVNRELVLLFWQVGKEILTRQAQDADDCRRCCS